MTLMSIITNLMHLGMVIVGLPYSFRGLSMLDEVTGGTPLWGDHHHGGRWLASADRQRARGRPFQGRYVGSE
jgi:NAD(P)H dehydrogenase (quinone)